LLVAKVGRISDVSSAVFSQRGGFLAFQSSEPGLGGVPGAGGQVYYRNLESDTNVLVSLSRDGTAAGSALSFAPVISPDGRYVAYLSGAANLVTNATSGTNVFLWDATTARNSLVSVSDTGDGLNRVFQTSFAANGSLLVFRRDSDVYLYSITNGVVVQTISDAASASLSADGRFVACERSGSYAPGDSNVAIDVYLIDRLSGAVSLISANRDGTGSGNGRSFSPLMTSDGRYVLFRSRASNLVVNDTNRQADLFLRDLALGTTILVSLNRNGSASANGLSASPVISADGSTIVFESYASDLGSGDYNNAKDIFVLRLGAGDSDGDGLPDDWELAYFNGLGRDGSGDFDGDGHTDMMEFRAGTNPNSDTSVLQVISLISLNTGQTTILWSAVPGKTYRIQYKDQINDSTWSELAGDIAPSDVTGTKVDQSVGASFNRFYRVLLLP
jgi:Tol biopolymer transport system component